MALEGIMTVKHFEKTLGCINLIWYLIRWKFWGLYLAIVFEENASSEERYYQGSVRKQLLWFFYIQSHSETFTSPLTRRVGDRSGSRAETQSSWWNRAEGAERGSDRGASLLLTLTALPHGYTNAAAACGLPSSVWCVQFIQFRGDKCVRRLCMCVMGKNINYSLLVSSEAKRKAGSPTGQRGQLPRGTRASGLMLISWFVLL